MKLSTPFLLIFAAALPWSATAVGETTGDGGSGGAHSGGRGSRAPTPLPAEDEYLAHRYSKHYYRPHQVSPALDGAAAAFAHFPARIHPSAADDSARLNRELWDLQARRDARARHLARPWVVRLRGPRAPPADARWRALRDEQARGTRAGARRILRDHRWADMREQWGSWREAQDAAMRAEERAAGPAHHAARRGMRARQDAVRASQRHFYARVGREVPEEALHREGLPEPLYTAGGGGGGPPAGAAGGGGCATC